MPLRSAWVVSASDVVQAALHCVLLGTHFAIEGRKPRLVELADQGSFLNYLRGFIASKAEALTRRSKLNSFAS